MKKTLDQIFAEATRSVKRHRKAIEKNAQKIAKRDRAELVKRKAALDRLISRATATIRAVVKGSSNVRKVFFGALTNRTVHVGKRSWMPQYSRGFLLRDTIDSEQCVAIEFSEKENFELLHAVIDDEKLANLGKVLHNRLTIVPVLRGHQQAYGIVWQETGNPSKETLELLKKLQDPESAIHVIANNLT